ncbi:PREDICTED: uncharacterized protein LOC109588753 [Amphimedon queenslandica]|uniref:SAM domain-containing protein n=1 Tax=Amphimedon queenslandica TaxID=400682 RepID=A0AAN0JUA0_AMPQE|nr:PREDICTED: uncharacterized protein LOC109588753 [Amphimedon queenslandica]|eukprot:XP_019860430.1 PREDICTED: uncharacterized protein LOC109588753 [Amphimedon queenslandica]
MKRMIQNSYQRPTGLLHELEKRDEYEKMWHAQIFVPSLKEVENNFTSYLSKLKADDLVAKLNLRELGCTYLHVPTLQQFTHFVQRHCASSEQKGKYDVLVKLINSYSRLQSYSALLPSLIEFYQWIVTDLSHDLTQEESTKMGICSAVKYASEKYSKDVEKNYTKLFERVQNDYNEYLKVIDFSIGAGACANVQRKNEVPLMNDAVFVFRFLPGGTSVETEEERDYLFLVIQDIVNFHNNFLREINELIKRNDNLKKYLSTLSDEENAEFAMPRVHPLAVNEYSCILGHNVSNRRLLLELVHKHQTETGYDLDKIQEEIVVHFIAGKLRIDDCQTKLKLQFHYKVMRTEQSKMQHPTELMLTLDQLNDKDMKKSIPQDEGFLTALKYELYTLDYDKLVEVAHCLKTIAEHIIKKIEEGQILKNDIIDQNVGDVLPKIVYDQEDQHDSLKVFDDLGMNKLQNTHRVRIVAIPMKHLLTTLQVIVEWIKDGIYDFHTLPKAMKVPLTKEDEEKIFAIQKDFKQNHIDELLEKLKGIVVVLTDCEQDLMKKIDEEPDVSIFQYLRNLSLVTDDDENLIKLFPKHIKPRHYMALRICLRKVIICIEEERLDEGSHKNKWSEYIEDLWSEEKLEHLREMATEIDYTQVYDPVKGAYGFDDEEIIAEENIITEEDESMPEVSQDFPNLSRPETIIEEAPPAAQTSDHDLSAAAEKVTSTEISNYLRSLKLDQYIEEFMEMEIDGIALFDIDDETLETLGVDTKKDRLKIKTRFKQWLRKKPV